MKFEFTYERTCKGVYILTAEGCVEIEQDGHYPGHWKFGRMWFEDMGETYTLHGSNAFDVALRQEITTWLKTHRSEQIEEAWLAQLPEWARARVLEDLRPERTA